MFVIALGEAVFEFVAALEGIDDMPHERVAHDVGAGRSRTVPIPSIPSKVAIAFISPLSERRGRSICVTSPVTMNLALRPMRVRTS